MSALKKILTSIHGRRVGLAQDAKLVVHGRTALTQDDAGLTPVLQAAPGALDATGTLTAALLATGIVTSSAASAVTATLDTGALMDDGFPEIAIGEAFDWSAINTHATNAFTVAAAASGHTVVGNMVLDGDAAGRCTSGRFRSRRTAADTWITYRIA